MSTIEKTKVLFANVPVADFVGIILDGGERADEAMYREKIAMKGNRTDT